MSGPILVALDAAHPSPEAEALALTLADATGGDLLLATVFPVIELHARVDRRPYERLLRQEAEGFVRAAPRSCAVAVRARSRRRRRCSAACRASCSHRLAGRC